MVAVVFLAFNRAGRIFNSHGRKREFDTSCNELLYELLPFSFGVDSFVSCLYICIFCCPVNILYISKSSLSNIGIKE